MRKSDERSAPQAGSSTVSSQEYWANREGEEEARHVMGAVPWIELAIIAPMFLCVVAALVLLLG